MKTFSALTANGKELQVLTPQVMGILNLTPDSFYDASRKQTEKEIEERTRQILSEGATIVDCGAMSTRPGGDFVSEEEELRRMREGLRTVRKVVDEEFPQAWVSIDTFRPAVARMAVEEFGADIINDVSEGGRTGLEGVALEKTAGPGIFQTVAELGVPYILMSVQPDIDTMVSTWMHEINELRGLGVNQIILDPGYGFGKTMPWNFEILHRQQELIDIFHLPLLAGMSRKRMIWQTLETSPQEALNGTTVVNTIALMNGASILRVHDVREAVEVVKLAGSQFEVKE